ncbi:MFS transporter [Sulfurimonas sp.]|uniref:MFS transporter n=1 Tax=Sulfurimonas sp. TaxID=2022749 RepID=UPI002B464531|nr:MFS transporter [Sulfurimonas sp.]
MKEIKILMLVNVLCVSAMMAFLAVVGPIIRALNMQEWHAGLTVSVGGILWVLLSRYWGKKSDIVGRKPILLIGVAGVAISYLIMAIFIDFAVVTPPLVIISLVVLVLTRGAIGAFFSAITPVSNALIADHIEESKRTAYISKLAASSGIAMVFAPSIGGALASYGLSVPLYTFAVLPLLGAVILYFYLPSEKVVVKKDMPVPKLFDIRLRLPMITAFITMFGVVTAQVCLGFFVIDKLNVDLIEGAKITGFVLSCIGVAFIVAQIIISKVDINPYNLLKFGSLVGLLGYIIVVMMTSQLILTIGFSITAFGMGMLFPAFQALAVNLVTKHEQGASSGTVSAAQGMGIVVAPIVSTAVYQINPIAPFILTALAFGLLFIISFQHIKKLNA